MSQHYNLELLLYDERIILAIKAIERDPKLSDRRAATMFEVKRRTLRDRRDGKLSRRDIHPNSSNLKKLEEEAIARYIRRLEAQGFAPTLAYVGDIAN